MARPLKRTVDYFPHFVNAGKTLLILQNEFGNDGYAFWFKLLALLCKTDGQVYDYNNLASWRLLLAETNVSEDIANKILQLLADIEAIDPELYLAKIIWVQNLVDNLADVYTRRRNGFVPSRPVIDNINPVNVSKNPQTILDQTILDQTRPDHTKPEGDIHAQKSVKKQISSDKFDTFWKAYPKKRAKGEAEKAFAKINPDKELLAVILKAIEQAKMTRQWLENNGEYIPHPATWLNRKG